MLDLDGVVPYRSSPSDGVVLSAQGRARMASALEMVVLFSPDGVSGVYVSVGAGVLDRVRPLPVPPRGSRRERGRGWLRVVEGEERGHGGPYVLAFGSGPSWLR